MGQDCGVGGWGGGVEMCAEEKDLKKPRNPGSQGLGLGRGESMEH